MLPMTPRPPSPGAATALALVVLASLARPARGLAGFPDAVGIQVPCKFDYECNNGVCRNTNASAYAAPLGPWGRLYGPWGWCDCLGGWATINATAPCDTQAHSYQEIMLVTYLGLGAFGVEAFQLGWVRWGVAIVVLLVGAAALCARGRYLQATRDTGLARFDYGGQLLGDDEDTDDGLRAQEDLALCCGCVWWTALCGSRPGSPTAPTSTRTEARRARRAGSRATGTAAPVRRAVRRRTAPASCRAPPTWPWPAAAAVAGPAATSAPSWRIGTGEMSPPWRCGGRGGATSGRASLVCLYKGAARMRVLALPSASCRAASHHGRWNLRRCTCARATRRRGTRLSRGTCARPPGWDRAGGLVRWSTPCGTRRTPARLDSAGAPRTSRTPC